MARVFSILLLLAKLCMTFVDGMWVLRVERQGVGKGVVFFENRSLSVPLRCESFPLEGLAVFITVIRVGGGDACAWREAVVVQRERR